MGKSLAGISAVLVAVIGLLTSQVWGPPICRAVHVCQPDLTPDPHVEAAIPSSTTPVTPTVTPTMISPTTTPTPDLRAKLIDICSAQTHSLATITYTFLSGSGNNAVWEHVKYSNKECSFTPSGYHLQSFVYGNKSFFCMATPMPRSATSSIR